MEKEETKNQSQFQGKIHGFVGAGSDRTGAGWSETVEGSIKVVKYYSKYHAITKREFG